MTTPNTDLQEQIEASARKVMRRSALIADVDLSAHIAAAVLPIVEAAVKRGQAEAWRAGHVTGFEDALLACEIATGAKPGPPPGPTPSPYEETPDEQ